MKSHRTERMTFIGLMTALLCIISPFTLILPFSPIPVSLCTLGIYLVAVLSGAKSGFISVVLYILLGIAGLPVFSGFSGGIGRILGPTGGFILSYPLMALLCGLAANFRHKNNRPLFLFLGMIPGTLVCYLFGTLWLSLQSGISIPAALYTAVLPFLPGDFIKLFLAVFLGSRLQKRLAPALSHR